MKEIIANNYSVWIGYDCFSKFNYKDYLKIAILVDENTEKNCLPILLKEIPKIKDSIIIRIRSGEKNKKISTCNYIWEQLSKNNFDRQSTLINLGGGVIGDMGGYCAATFKRGIKFHQIPTTLLSMVDASIGGKLGVNLNGQKNQIGLFKNPESTLINPVFLNTLNDYEMKSGFAEIIKHTLIADKIKWTELIKTQIDNIKWGELIYHSVNIKNTIVVKDPIDKKERKKLNFGHTYGHAIESFYLQKGTPISHGESVLMGILLETEMSHLNNNDKLEIKNYILSNFNLPNIPMKQDLIEFMKNDKKNKNNKINFSLLEGIGKCSIDNLFSENEL